MLIKKEKILKWQVDSKLGENEQFSGKAAAVLIAFSVALFFNFYNEYIIIILVHTLNKVEIKQVSASHFLVKKVNFAKIGQRTSKRCNFCSFGPLCCCTNCV